MLKLLYDAYILDKKSIHAHRVHRVTFTGKNINRYNKWVNKVKDESTSLLNFSTGVGGVLYPPKCFHHDICNKKLFLNLSKYTDDIWFWAMAILNGTKIHKIPNGISIPKPIEGTQAYGLWDSINSNGNNDRNIESIIKHYPQILDILLGVINSDL